MDEQGTEQHGSDQQPGPQRPDDQQRSEQQPGGGRDASRRPAPAGYGSPSRDPHAPTAGAEGRPFDPPAGSFANPVYGRVTRFGAPGEPAGAHPAGWPPPAPLGPPLTAGARGVPAGPAPAPWGVQGQPAAPYGWPAGPAGWTPGTVWTPPAPHWQHDDYASWVRRVLGNLVDHLPAYVALVFLLVGYVPLYAGLLRGELSTPPTWWALAVGMVLSLASTGWNVYNRWVVAGRTGQSLGKRVTRTWLVGLDDGRPIGVLNAFLRDLLHVLDGFAYVGYLWPLWDEHRQTLADKIIRTVVVRTPVPPLDEHERSTRA